MERKLKAAIPLILVGLCLIAMFDLTSHIGTMRDLRADASAPHDVLQALIGFAVGCYGTLVGIGGGPILVPLLIFFYPWPSDVIVAGSLFLVFLNALSGSIGYAVQRRIDVRGGLIFALAAMPGALASSLIHHVFNISSFNLIFGAFLLALAGYSLARIDRVDVPLPAGASGRRVVIDDALGNRYDFRSNDKLGITLNVILGFGCGFLGIGGGVFQVPILVFVLRYPTHIATATSHFVTLQTCAFALIPSMVLGHVEYAKLVWLGAGVIVGAQVGARLAARLRSRTVISLYILILFGLATKLIFSG